MAEHRRSADKGEGERNVKSEKKKSRMQMHSGFLANPVSLERPEREPVIWAKKKSLVAETVGFEPTCLSLDKTITSC